MRHAPNVTIGNRNRRSFLKTGLDAAGEATVGVGLLEHSTQAAGQSSGLTTGDAVTVWPRLRTPHSAKSRDFGITQWEFGEDQPQLPLSSLSLRQRSCSTQISETVRNGQPSAIAVDI